MGLFSRRKTETPDPEIARLRDRVHELETKFRLLESEQIDVHDRVRKWMRRAVAAERNQERATAGIAGHPRETPATRAPLWGARARIEARRAARRNDGVALQEPEEQSEEENNGVHP